MSQRLSVFLKLLSVFESAKNSPSAARLVSLADYFMYRWTSSAVDQTIRIGIDAPVFIALFCVYRGYYA